MMPNMINRSATLTLKKMAKSYPVITITGPRQSGKTTLARFVFAHKPYVSLEEPDQMEFAQEDPRGGKTRTAIVYEKQTSARREEDIPGISAN